MKKLLCLGLILAFLLMPVPAQAQQVNKFGIHILEPSEIFLAQELVNSSGGDWGFVTIVIRADDRNPEKWQKFFDDCRELHLVPIIRIAQYLEKDYWVKPNEQEIGKWLEFLSSLNWPTKDRYVVIFNEPNHKKEWGGELNPQEYARILDRAITDFHKLSSDYKILNAGFDLAAANSSTTMEAQKFWLAMDKEIPGIFTRIDAWSSHSYPNHGFIGKPSDSGKASVKGYQWELTTLEKLFSVKKDLPVFITETGWPYQISKKEIFCSEKTASEYLTKAFQDIWLPDPRIVSITPFVLFYPQVPFANFSWIKADKSKSLQFTTIQEISKQNWWPEQSFSFNIEKFSLPDFMPTRSDYNGVIRIKNTGQSIWGEHGAVKFVPLNDQSVTLSEISIPEQSRVKPGESVNLDFTIKTGTQSGIYPLSWKNLPVSKLRVVPATTINKVRYSFWQKIKTFLRLTFQNKTIL